MWEVKITALSLNALFYISCYYKLNVSVLVSAILAQSLLGIDRISYGTTANNTFLAEDQS